MTMILKMMTDDMIIVVWIIMMTDDMIISAVWFSLITRSHHTGVIEDLPVELGQGPTE